MRAWGGVMAGWAVILLGVVVWLGTTPFEALRTQLITRQFWWLEVCVLAVFVSVVLVTRELRELGNTHFMRMALLASVAVAITLFVAPRTHRIFYDEQIYQGIGQNLSDLRRAQMCLDGTVEYGRLECTAGEYNKQPYAYPHLLSLAYRVGGAQWWWAFVLNAIAMALTVVAVYFIVLLLFDDGVSAFFAGLIIALTPQQLIWSATAAVEPLASLTCALAVAATALFVRTRSHASLAAAVAMTAYAVQFRPESALIALSVAALLIQRAPEEFKTPRLWWAAALGLGLIVVHVGHLFAIRNEGWGTSEARFSLEYVWPNLAVNGGFYAGDERFPIAYTLLAIAGVTATGLAAGRFAIVVYVLSFFVVTLFFYAGSYNYGADVRYSLMTYPPLAILGGLGAGRLAAIVSRAAPRLPARRLVLAALIFQFLWYAPLIRATTDEAWAARTDVAFAQQAAAELPANSYVLTHNPGMFHLWGVNAGQMFLAADNPARVRFLSDRYAGGVYLHWNFWCNVADPAQQELCRKVLAMTPTELWRERRERDQRFAFLRVTPPAVVPPAPESSGQEH